MCSNDFSTAKLERHVHLKVHEAVTLHHARIEGPSAHWGCILLHHQNSFLITFSGHSAWQMCCSLIPFACNMFWPKLSDINFVHFACPRSRAVPRALPGAGTIGAQFKPLFVAQEFQLCLDTLGHSLVTACPHCWKICSPVASVVHA